VVVSAEERTQNRRIRFNNLSDTVLPSFVPQLIGRSLTSSTDQSSRKEMTATPTFFATQPPPHHNGSVRFLHVVRRVIF
jgi:hypothetical protein